MKENIVQKLTSKDDKYACAFTDRIVAESHDTDDGELVLNAKYRLCRGLRFSDEG